LDAPAATPLTHLLEQRGVLITPGSRFAIDGTLERFLRIPFALPVADLQTAVHRIAETWSKLDVDRLPRRNTAALVPA
jgi:aspartate/methionine/tyrosine aminotransferase